MTSVNAKKRLSELDCCWGKNQRTYDQTMSRLYYDLALLVREDVVIPESALNHIDRVFRNMSNDWPNHRNRIFERLEILATWIHSYK